MQDLARAPGRVQEQERGPVGLMHAVGVVPERVRVRGLVRGLALERVVLERAQDLVQGQTQEKERVEEVPVDQEESDTGHSWIRSCTLRQGTYRE